MSLLQTFKQALPLSITLLAKRKKTFSKSFIQLLNSSIKSCWKWARTLKRYLLSCSGNLFINFEQFKHIISASLLWSLNMILSGRYHWITKVKVILKYLQDSSMQLIFEVLIINTKFMNWAIAWMCSKLTTETLKQHKPSFYKTWKQQNTKGFLMFSKGIEKKGAIIFLTVWQQDVTLMVVIIFYLFIFLFIYYLERLMTLDDLSYHVYTKHTLPDLHIVKGCTNWQTKLLQKYFYWEKNWFKKYSCCFSFPQKMSQKLVEIDEKNIWPSFFMIKSNHRRCSIKNCS